MRCNAGSLGKILGCWVIWGAALAAPPTERVGQVFRQQGDAAGPVLPQSEVVSAGRVLLSLNEVSIVHLDNGEVLRLDENSSAIFRPLSESRIEVKVLSGRAHALGDSGRWLTAGSGSRFTLRARGYDPREVEERLLGAAPERIRRERPGNPDDTRKRIRRISD